MKPLFLALILIVFSTNSMGGNRAMGTPLDDPAKPLLTSTNKGQLIQKMLKKFGKPCEARISRGVEQAAAFWKKEDGTPAEFEEFCLTQFIPEPGKLQEALGRFERNFEAILGHFLKLTREISEPFELDIGEMLPADELFAKFSPSNHFQEDLFSTKLGFLMLLNFPQTNLEEKLKNGESWTREQWAEARLCDLIPARVPSAVNQNMSSTLVDTTGYINEYNLYPGFLVTADKQTHFPEDLKLISHWGLRDEIKAQYAQKDGLICQELIFKAMERIVEGSIPLKFINSRGVYWDPIANSLFEKKGGKFMQTPIESENDRRYAKLLSIFKASREVDRYYPKYPRFIDQKFNLERQIPEPDFEKLLVTVLSSDVVPRVAELVARRLKRPLQPFDIWYSGFKPGRSFSEADLDKKLRAKYPNVAAFQKDIPNLLQGLGFSAKTAQFLSDRIVVDSSRSAGHAMGAQMRTDKAHLRTRIPKEGMNYKGFNIAIHELGHNVEQTFSLYKTDHFILSGVPNNAFTECFAFVFQNQDLKLLGVSGKDPHAEDEMALETFWATFEIAGVALLDMRIWRWMYEHPQAKPQDLRVELNRIAREIWNTYYAPVFQVKDTPILGIYSHMLTNPLYLPDYPLGHIVCFQIERFLRGKSLGTEMERMCVQGCIPPRQWLKGAVGSDISAEFLIQAARDALTKIH